MAPGVEGGPGIYIRLDMLVDSFAPAVALGVCGLGMNRARLLLTGWGIKSFGLRVLAM